MCQCCFNDKSRNHTFCHSGRCCSAQVVVCPAGLPPRQCARHPDRQFCRPLRWGGHGGRHQSWLMAMLKTETPNAGAPPQVPGDDARHQICEKIQQSDALDAVSQHKRARTALTRNTAIRVFPKAIPVTAIFNEYHLVLRQIQINNSCVRMKWQFIPSGHFSHTWRPKGDSSSPVGPAIWA